ncbi:MAG: SCP2 sterol-binding domain-containing protein [Deltaproteobacteria bacterium]|nr:SCP2 sterol-binding domain-containing protein [Deltaproteobacteria bacterium]
MPAIFTPEWYDAMVKLANSRDDLSKKVPKGEYRFAVELKGDGKSPYVSEGSAKYFFIRFVDGKVSECKETPEPIPGKELNYRITGPASIFEGIAAGLLDPIETGLNGSLAIRGDMRFLMQNAEMANVIFDVYTSSDLTEWPKGKPPYA